MRGTGEPALTAGARTPVCAAGGALRECTTYELARAAAEGALGEAGRPASELAAIVVCCSTADSADASGVAAGLRDDLGASSAIPIQLSGALSAGLEALVVARGLCARSSGPVLAVGAESASRAPYLSLRRRWGGGDHSAQVGDPLGAILAAQGRRGEFLAGRAPGRAAQDAFAHRSRRLAQGDPAAGSSAAVPVVPVSGVEADEPPRPVGSAQTLAELKPAFSKEGTVTAGNAALPADGAAAALLLPAGDGPSVCEATPTAPSAVLAAGLERGGLHAVEIHEGTAAEALAAAAELGAEEEMINQDGGAIGRGAPFGACGLLMALRLRARLGPDQPGLLSAPACSIALRC